MSLFLERFRSSVAEFPNRVVFRNSAGESITYEELDSYSDALACFFMDSGNGSAPVVLYGHKEPFMLVGIIACLKAGCAYVPVDVMFPEGRVSEIVGQLDEPLVVCACACVPEFRGAGRVVSAEELSGILRGKNKCSICAGDNPAYIIFTSGSTGKPKGVVQTVRTVDCFMQYMCGFLPEGNNSEPLIIFDRASFSFDFSLGYIVMALSTGNTMFSLCQKEEDSLSRTFESLSKSNTSVWIAVPSYLDMCMMDPSFTQELLPELKVIITGGEVLHRSSAKKVYDRFPSVRLINTYGPTETQQICDVEITPEMIFGDKPLPIGKPSSFNSFAIYNRDTEKRVSANTPGEIVVFGDTLAQGYLGQPEISAKQFKIREDNSGNLARSYATGDKGYLDESGMLHFIERFDLQVKLNGYRIELTEIEEVLNSQKQVVLSCVVPVHREGRVKSLRAFVVLESGIDAGRDTTNLLKQACREKLPRYMVPHSFKYVDKLPLTNNCKVNRELLM